VKINKFRGKGYICLRRCYTGHAGKTSYGTGAFYFTKKGISEFKNALKNVDKLLEELPDIDEEHVSVLNNRNTTWENVAKFENKKLEN